jgi:hypothetical protein
MRNVAAQAVHLGAAMLGIGNVSDRMLGEGMADLHRIVRNNLFDLVEVSFRHGRFAAEETDIFFIRFSSGPSGVALKTKGVALGAELLGKIAGVRVMASDALSLFVGRMQRVFLGLVVTGEAELIFRGGQVNVGGFALSLDFVTTGATHLYGGMNRLAPALLFVTLEALGRVGVLGNGDRVLVGYDAQAAHQDQQ